MSRNTAILIFANSPEEELRQKPFAKDVKLFDELTQHTLKIVKKTNLPYFHLTEKQQEGDTFGERFVNAVQNVFDQGYDQIITIGNDTPLLRTKNLLEAHRSLQSQKPILGPSVDGGFYLLGLHHSQFDAHAFLNLPWQTSKLTSEILTLPAMAKTEVNLLPTLFDIDKAIDLNIVIRFSKKCSPALHRTILDLISQKKERIFAHGPKSVAACTLQTPFNKGSPLTF